MNLLDLIVVGGGPAGLAAAIAAQKAGLDYQVLEKGVLVNSIFHFPSDMVFFTTPELLEIGAIPFTTPYQKPTRTEALRYYRRVSDTYQLRVSLNQEVISIARRDACAQNGSVFAVETRAENGSGAVHHGRTVVLATGYYDHPNRLEIPGEDLPHVRHYYTEPHPFYRKQVVIVGGKNSAAEAALDLYRAGAQVTLVHRRDQLGESIKYWVRPDIENRIKEGSIQARFNTRVREIRPESVIVESNGDQDELPAQGIFLLTGYHPDADLLKRAGVEVDEQSFVPTHNPETLETNVPGLYLAGAVVTGKETNRVFIENGRFHGESVVAVIRARLGR